MKKWLVFAVITAFCLNVFAAQPHSRKKERCVSPSAAHQFLKADLASRPQLRPLATAGTTAQTVGNVVVLEADPELLIVSNPFDLKRNGIRLTPALSNRYLYNQIPYSYNADVSETLELGDDDSVELTFRNFLFPFSGKLRDRCYVNSNGNITFDVPDNEPPNAETLLEGPPRIAAFFSDLDPESSGTIFVSQTAETVVISWLKVPEFFSQNQFGYGQNTFQVVLYKDGRIDLIYSDEMTATQALVGIVPGYGKSQLRLVDLTRGSAKGRPFASFIENFHDYESINIPEVMKTLYKSYKDSYDFVTLLSNFDLTPLPGAQAFALNTQNDVRGIGNPSGRGSAIFRDTSRYGSSGRLQNITFAGNIHQYPDVPTRSLPDTYTSFLQILGHEVGHRWLSYVKTSRDGSASDMLLGRDKSHWSFFFDSEGSLMEGNDITAQSSSSFVTGKPFTRYSRLDLYLMGLIPASEVGPSFVVEGAGKFSPAFDFLPESAPEPNVSFSGSLRPVHIEDIVAINGKRTPDSTQSHKTFNHLFVLIAKKESPASEEEIALVDQWRSAWEQYFSTATSGKGRIVTNVQ